MTSTTKFVPSLGERDTYLLIASFFGELNLGKLVRIKNWNFFTLRYYAEMTCAYYQREKKNLHSCLNLHIYLFSYGLFLFDRWVLFNLVVSYIMYNPISYWNFNGIFRETCADFYALHCNFFNIQIFVTVIKLSFDNSMLC